MELEQENSNRLSVHHDASAELGLSFSHHESKGYEFTDESVTEDQNSLTSMNASSPTISTSPLLSMVPEKSVLRNMSALNLEPASITQDQIPVPLNSAINLENDPGLNNSDSQQSQWFTLKTRRPLVPSRHPRRAPEGAEPENSRRKNKRSSLKDILTTEKNLTDNAVLPYLNISKKKQADTGTAELQISKNSIAESKEENKMGIIDDYNNGIDDEKIPNGAKKEDCSHGDDESYNIDHYQYDSEFSSEGECSYDTDYDSFDESDFEMITASRATAAVATIMDRTSTTLIENNGDTTSELHDITTTVHIPEKNYTELAPALPEKDSKTFEVKKINEAVSSSFSLKLLSEPSTLGTVANISSIPTSEESSLPMIKPTRTLLNSEKLSQYTTKITNLSLSLLESENQHSVLSSKLHHLNTLYNKNQDIITNYKQEIGCLRSETKELEHTLFAETDILVKKSQQEKENLEDDCETLRRKLNDKDDQLDGTKEMLMQMKMIIQNLEEERKYCKEAAESYNNNTIASSISEKEVCDDLHENNDKNGSLHCPQRPSLRVDLLLFREFAELIPFKHPSSPSVRGLGLTPTNDYYGFLSPNASVSPPVSPKSATGFLTNFNNNSPASISSSTFPGFSSISTSSSLPNSPLINSYSTFSTVTAPMASTQSLSRSTTRQSIPTSDRQSMFSADTTLDCNYSDSTSFTGTLKSHQIGANKNYCGYSESTTAGYIGNNIKPVMKSKKSQDGPISFKDTKFFKRCLLEDIEPMFKFDFNFTPNSYSNMMSKKKLLESIIDGNVFIGPISGVNETWIRSESVKHAAGYSGSVGQNNLRNNNQLDSSPKIPGIYSKHEAKEDEINQLRMYLYPVNGPPIAVLNCCSVCGERRNDFIRYARMYNLIVHDKKSRTGSCGFKTRGSTGGMSDKNGAANGSYKDNADHLTNDDDGFCHKGEKLYPLCQFCVNRIRATCDFITFLHNLATGIWRIDGYEQDQLAKFRPSTGNGKAPHWNSGGSWSGYAAHESDNDDTVRAWRECVRLRERMFWSRNAGCF
ncbi:hypothetical protein NADFUDRAFT_81318 [Nadsonia fulvescens var. elongata DSM 6958]|uniref:GDP/GTP exchange factor Sec2 N-terminal domain-containing protein n=1 Tax=Nadsonia fulvescens var. elongata DSM 6958 TaxID=857566 RepID=A0A1E3PSB5_9ASCO|nr:hypothetical protein NADFUDRAFT_81318 [Nadsonia fulvescens var. elongata DSM 6958]